MARRAMASQARALNTPLLSHDRLRISAKRFTAQAGAGGEGGRRREASEHCTQAWSVGCLPPQRATDCASKSALLQQPDAAGTAQPNPLTGLVG